VQVAGPEARFVHDRLRAALLASVDPAMRSALAAGMAERLLRAPYAVSSLRAALQFRLAAGLEAAQPAEWRDRFCEEALAARNAADSTTATAFAEAAWALRQRERGTERDADMLILREATFAAARRRDVTTVRARAAEMLALAATTENLGRAYEVAINAASLAGERELAWAWVVQGVGALGARLPAKANRMHLILAAVRWRVGLMLPSPRPPPGQTTETVDPLRRIVHFGTVIAYVRDPLMMLIMSLRAATRARRLGYRSAFYATVDLVLHAAFRNPEKAAALGEAVLEQPISSTFGRAATLYRALYMGVIWTKPLASLRDGFARVYDIAISEGDFVYAGQAVRNAAQFAWRLEPELDGVATAIKEAQEKAEQLGDVVALEGMRAFAETIRVLRDPDGFADPGDAPPWSRLGVSAGAGAPIVWIEILGLRGDWAGVLTLAKRFDHARPALDPHPGGAIWRFHENLARLRLGLPPRRGDLRYVRRAARLNPTDHQRKLLVLQADVLRLKGNAEACLKVYANAVDVAAGGTSRLEAGLAAECAAAAARSFGRMELAAHYDRRAQATWRAWGAHAKIAPATVSDDEEPAPVRARLAEAESKIAVAVRSERAKSRFLAEVGHELRTPLQGMQGLLDLAAEAPAEVSLNELRDVFGSLKRVVDDLTDLAALGGGAPLNLAAADIVGLVQSELHLASGMAKRKGLQVHSDIPAAALLVMIDGARVRQIVRNLLSNAVKYTDRGDIALRLGAEPGVRADTRRLTISVDDSGPGLRESDLQRLFEPFERGEREDAEGLGLGLALSRQIAERMGGTLTAAIRPEGGSSFTLAFDAELSRGGSGAAPDAAPLSILLVEDVALNRRMIATMLGRHGHRVTEAADGTEALGLASERAFDLVLLDLGLPDVDGFTVLETIARLPRNRATPVVVLTAATSGAVAEQARRQDAVLVLHKPISASDLRAAIQTLFAARAPREAGSPSAFAAEMGDLSRQACGEILSRGRALAETPEARTMQQVHRLAGLAAQFGATEIAAAADRLEADMRRGVEESAGLARLQAALDAFAPGGERAREPLPSGEQ
jgi:signal transduction histidine kinase/DNA-binding response OmpR family regulator